MNVGHNELEVETLPVLALEVEQQPETLGRFIRKLRILQGISQRELGRSVGVCHSTIINWEKGRSRLSRKYLRRIAKVLNPPPSELLQYEEVTNSRQKRIIEFLRHNPMATERECREALRISWGLHKDFSYLMDIGVIERELRGITAYYRLKNS